MKQKARLVVEFLPSSNVLAKAIIVYGEIFKLLKHSAIRMNSMITMGAGRMVNLTSIIEGRDSRLVFVSGVKAHRQGKFVVLKDCRGKIVGRFPKSEIQRVYYRKTVFERQEAKDETK